MPKTNTMKMAKVAEELVSDDLGLGLLGLAKEIEGLAQEVRPLYHIEQMGDYVGEVANAVHHLANATAMSVICQYGTDEDRAAAVAYLKRCHSDEFRD
jgi:hypothetical protein